MILSQKKFLDPKILIQKKGRPNKRKVLKKLMKKIYRTNFRPQKFHAKNFFGSKNVWLKKIFVLKTFKLQK